MGRNSQERVYNACLKDFHRKSVQSTLFFFRRKKICFKASGGQFSWSTMVTALASNFRYCISRLKFKRSRVMLNVSSCHVLAIYANMSFWSAPEDAYFDRLDEDEMHDMENFYNVSIKHGDLDRIYWRTPYSKYCLKRSLALSRTSLVEKKVKNTNN